MINSASPGVLGTGRQEGWFLIFEVVLNQDMDILFREQHAAFTLSVESAFLTVFSFALSEQLRTASPSLGCGGAGVGAPQGWASPRGACSNPTQGLHTVQLFRPGICCRTVQVGIPLGSLLVT